MRAFLTHLDELRRRLIKVLLGLIAATLVCYNFVGKILPWLIKPACLAGPPAGEAGRPAGHLVFISPTEAFGAYMTLAVVMGFLVSLPWTLYQVWGFVASALRPHEKKFIATFGPLSFLFFLSGVLFAYFVAIPLTYKFLMSFSSQYMQPMITVGHYMGFLANMLIAFGVTFELPLILAFLAKIGIATPEFLRQKRRHAIMIILIMAAIVTPPDVISQILLALPLMLLYEVGIIFAKVCYRGHPKHKTL
ncbi:MAG: twin-arginine translocase subunit TatC [Candidatus Omnitrophica bacterium]|nr:twin-arginine translocase subunit TatC [Candidatus Omnitrophota bacterium]